MAEIRGLERELAAVQAEIQRVEWNRAIKAAARVAEEYAELGHGAPAGILRLLKPTKKR